MRFRNIGIFAAIATLSTAAYAASSGYGANAPSAPTIYQTNTVYSLGNFSNGGAPASGTITTLSYQANYNSAGTRGTTIARLCFNQAGTKTCNSWGNLNRTSISDFAGLPANTVFFLDVGVSNSVVAPAVLNPPVTPAGQSSISVNYNY